MINRTIDSIYENTAEVFSKEALEKKLQEKGQLRIKFGADPSAPDLHLGHSVLLKKLRTFQELGHVVDFIIGDFTAMIGDPSGRSKTRPTLERSLIEKNAQTYQDQIFKVLIRDKTNVVFNSAWLNGINLSSFLSIASRLTIARIIEREDFTKRIRANVPVALNEILYPLIQGYDSVHLKSDVEIGGTDQTFNLLLGRELQKSYGQSAQVVITMPIIEGTDGVKKMSKSLNNYIALQDPPKEMYGKIMSITDDIMWKYFTYLTDHTVSDIKSMQDKCQAGENPKTFKELLAKTIVSEYHSAEEASAQQEEFAKVFSSKKTPSKIPEVPMGGKSSIRLLDAVVLCYPDKSKSEVRRLIASGAVRYNDHKKTNPDEEVKLHGSSVLKVGKRNFFKLT